MSEDDEPQADEFVGDFDEDDIEDFMAEEVLLEEEELGDGQDDDEEEEDDDDEGEEADGSAAAADDMGDGAAAAAASGEATAGRPRRAAGACRWAGAKGQESRAAQLHRGG